MQSIPHPTPPLQTRSTPVWEIWGKNFQGIIKMLKVIFAFCIIIILYIYERHYSVVFSYYILDV